ncbi:uncharacterized protein TNCV_947321 [Trichonephila clavipes]|nr:uncharacterized protein TNCV_947321 [Trichonephila clavipes]
MTRKSTFAIQKAIQGIGGDPKSVKKLRSGDLLIETVSALQTKYFLLAKTFLDCPLTTSPHKSLNSSRGVISEPDLICTPEAEILEGFSGQGVIQSHSSDSKLCPKWKIEKQIQEIKTNNNISYQEARKLIAPQLSQTYAEVAKSSTATSTTQTDENITQIKCPPLQLLQPLLSVPQPNKYPSITSVSTSSSTTQANLLPSASSIKPTTEIESRLPEPISSSAAPDNSLNTSTSSLSAETLPLTRSNKSAALSTEIQPLPESDPTASNGEHFNAPEVPQCAKRNSRNRRKRPKVQKAEIKIKMAAHRPRKSIPTEVTTDEEDMIMYDVQAEELEPNPEDKFAVMECFVNNPSEYMRALTPTRFRNAWPKLALAPLNPTFNSLHFPQTSHTYAQAAKSSNKNSSTHTGENITKIKCPPLELLQPLSSKTRTNLSISTPDVSTSSSSTQAQLLPSTSSISTSNSESQPPIPTCNDAPSNNMVTPIESSSSIIPTSSSQSVIQPPFDSNTVQDAKKLAKARSRKRKKELLKKMKEAIIEIKMNPHRPKKPASDEYTTDKEEIIVYDVEDEIKTNSDYVKENECERTQLEVSEEQGITQSVISRLWQRFQDYGNLSRCYSTGRPRVTTPNEDRYLAVTAKRNRRITASDLCRQLSSATGTTV